MLDYAGSDTGSIQRLVGAHNSLVHILAYLLHRFGHLETSDSRNQRSDLSDYTPIVKRGERLVSSLVKPRRPEESNVKLQRAFGRHLAVKTIKSGRTPPGRDFRAFCQVNNTM